jgi:hypothetical protein
VVGRRLYVTEFDWNCWGCSNIIEVETINFKTMAYKGRLTGRLKVSIVSTGKYVMPYFLADFMKVNSGLNCKWMLLIRVDVIGLGKMKLILH